jgi:ABC-type sugar transport system substrate-binding protein
MLHQGLRPAAAGALAIAAAAVLAACGSSGSASSANTSGATPSAGTTKQPVTGKSGPLSGKTIVLSECCEDPSFASAWVPGIKAALAWSHSGASLTLVNANADNSTQLSQDATIVGQKAAGLMLITENPTGFASVAAQARKAGVVTTSFSGNPVVGANYNQYFPHYKAGYDVGINAGQWLKRTNAGKGDVGVTYDPTDPGFQQRVDGFIAGIKTILPDIKMRQAAAGAGTTAEGAQVASELLTADPSIKILFCYDEALALGCVTGAAEAGRTNPDNLYISDPDGSPSGFKEILKGTPLQDAMDPDFTAAAAVWALITQDAVEGKTVPLTGVANVTLVDKNNAQAAINAEKTPFSPNYIKRTLSAVALYKGTYYSLTDLPKGPGIQNYFGADPTP